MKRFLWLIIFFAGLAHGLTLSEMQTQVRRNVRDTATSSDFQRYPDATITDVLNVAQREVINAVWALTNDTSFSSVASTMFYDLDADFLAALKVGYLKTGSTTRTELTEKTLSGLYSSNPNWENQTGTPVHYYIRQKPGGTVQQLGLYPAPVSTSTGTVYLTEAIIPDDLSAGTDVPFEGASWLVPYHKVLVDYATGLLKQIEGKNDEAGGYFSMAAAGINRMRERLGEKPNYNPGMVTGGGQ